MPSRAPTICAEQGCAELVYQGNRCEQHRTEQRRTADRQRPNGTARGYTREWAAFSKDYLARHPQCESPQCQRLPAWQRPTATDVDHMHGHSRTCPHAYDTTHLQALCHPCHSTKTAKHDGSFGRPAADQRCRG